MTSGIRGPAVIDTGVFAARLTPSGSLLAARYRPLLEGRPAVISFVIVAELGYGARLAGWAQGSYVGCSTRQPGQRSSGRGHIWSRHMPRFALGCVRTGHGLGQKENDADRLVAATAIWLQVPLVAHDRIFRNVKDLELLTKLGN
jgi:predicted nucleic acid-binding protein